jgi:hypothetical protein
MSNQKEAKLSSGWTNVGLYGGAFLVIVITPLIYSILTDQKFHFGMLIAIAFYIGLTGFIIYQFLYVADAKVSTDRITLQKQFRPAKTYTFDKIGYPTSFRIKTTKYITVEMDNEDGTKEKYMIINSNAILAFENKDAEEALMSLRNLSRVPKP